MSQIAQALALTYDEAISSRHDKEGHIVKSDSELIREVLDGNPEAFTFLVQRYERLVRATALNICRDRHESEDIAQETFVTAFESLEKLQQPKKFGAWLLSIAKHKAARLTRAGHNRERTVLDAESLVPITVDPLSIESLDLLALVDRLPEHERVVVGLKHFEGHSVQDVSYITGRQVGTVTKQLSRAYERLRQWSTQEVQR